MPEDTPGIGGTIETPPPAEEPPPVHPTLTAADAWALIQKKVG